MYISKLAVTNIRSFEQLTIDFSPTVTVIVGENNSGKSTILQSLMILQSPPFGGEAVRIGVPTGEICVELSAISADMFHASLRGHLMPHLSSDLKCTVVSGLTSNPQSTSMVLRIGDNGPFSFSHFSNEQPNNLLVPFLSTRRSVGYSEQIHGGVAYAVNSGFQYLPAKIDACFTSRELHDPYLEACNEVIGASITSWTSQNGKMAGLEVDARQRLYIPLSNMGAGVSHSVALIIELLLAENKVFLIEELENDLHPRALRTLMRLIERSIARGNQFIVSTHSNVVARHLGGRDDAKIYQVDRKPSEHVPLSTVSLVAGDPSARLKLIESLGYDLLDYDLNTGWLICEESSAERLIREFLIPWFVPELIGTVRTVAAKGAHDLEARFTDLHRLFVFVHLQPLYRRRAWVIADGDAAGQGAVETLRRQFTDWPPDHFHALGQEAFEYYYPAEFSERVNQVLAIPDKQLRRRGKAELIEAVVQWLREDSARGRAALKASAVEVLQQLFRIRDALSFGA